MVDFLAQMDLVFLQIDREMAPKLLDFLVKRRKYQQKNLKEERLVNPTMSISEFKQVCFERGLNEYRKDLRVFDC